MAAAREPPSTRSQRNNPCFDDPRSATARPPNPSPPISARRKPGTIASVRPGCRHETGGWLSLERSRFRARRSEEHTSELKSLMRISYAVFCLKKKKNTQITTHNHHSTHQMNNENTE